MKYITNVILGLFLMIAISSFSSIGWEVTPTVLKITVIDELGNPVQGAIVVLFETEEDYRAETNPSTDKQLTDEKGVVKFKKLNAMAYYVLAEFDGKNNNGAGVLTQKLEEGKTNRVNTVIR